MAAVRPIKIITVETRNINNDAFLSCFTFGYRIFNKM